MRGVVMGILLLLSGLIVLGHGGSRPVAASCTPEHYVQKDAGGGGVQITVTYVTPEYVEMTKDSQRMKGYRPDRYALFLVQLDSHSVDVSGYRLAQLSRLTGGGRNLSPLRWEETVAGTHHRAGVLVFPRVNPPLPAGLVIRGIAGVSARTFRWQP
jgi:hypothetical protein